MRMVVPLPRSVYIDLAAELVQIGLDHVHAHSAPGDIGDLFGRGQSGEEYEVGLFLVGHGLGLVRRDEASGQGLGHDLFRIEPRAVIDDLDDDLSGLMVGLEHDGTHGGLARGHAHVGHLDAVIGRIAHQVGQRIAQTFDDGLIELDIVAFQLQVDLLAQVAGQVADHARKLVENVAHGLHAGQHDRFLQLGRDQVDALPGHLDLVDGIGGNGLHELVAAQNQFSGQVHQIFEQTDMHAQGVGLGNG